MSYDMILHSHEIHNKITKTQSNNKNNIKLDYNDSQ